MKAIITTRVETFEVRVNLPLLSAIATYAVTENEGAELQLLIVTESGQTPSIASLLAVLVALNIDPVEISSPDTSGRPAPRAPGSGWSYYWPTQHAKNRPAKDLLDDWIKGFKENE